MCIQSSNDVHLVCVHILVNRNNSALNIHSHTNFVWAYVFNFLGEIDI